MATNDAKAAKLQTAASNEKVVPKIDVAPTYEDDASQVDTAIARLRKCFTTGKTKSYTYRIGQLK